MGISKPGYANSKSPLRQGPGAFWKRTQGLVGHTKQCAELYRASISTVFIAASQCTERVDRWMKARRLVDDHNLSTNSFSLITRSAFSQPKDDTEFQFISIFLLFFKWLKIHACTACTVAAATAQARLLLHVLCALLRCLSCSKLETAINSRSA